MTFDTAKAIFTGKYFRYSHFYKNEKFFLKKINVDDLPKHRLRDTTDYYVNCLKQNIYIPPIWIICGYKLRNGIVCPFHYGPVIMDGNHRLGAHREMGEETIDVIMSESQYELFEEYLNFHLVGSI